MKNATAEYLKNTKKKRKEKMDLTQTLQVLSNEPVMILSLRKNENTHMEFDACMIIHSLAHIHT